MISQTWEVSAGRQALWQLVYIVADLLTRLVGQCLLQLSAYFPLRLLHLVP